MSALGVLALLGVVMLALGGALAAFRGRAGIGLSVQAAGMALLGVAGVLVLTSGSTVGAPFTSALAPALRASTR